MKILFVFNRTPYDGTNVVWNGLWLAERLFNAGLEVSILLTPIFAERSALTFYRFPLTVKLQILA